jgi:hypothetical protein
MAISKFIIPPDNSSYSVTDGSQVIATQLDGGAARYRRDILGATSKVGVSWTLGPEEYKYLRSFYRALCVSGSRPFLIDLILDDPVLTEHKAYFVPNSMQLTGQKGLTYFVACQLEVYPAEMDLEAEADFAAIYSYWGKDWKNKFPAFDDELNTLINIEIPNDIAV